MKPRRYQLKKDAVAILERGHPWLFRAGLSTAASVFADGDWLKLVDGANRVIGHGIYEAEGAIAIRVLRRGPEPVTAAYLDGLIAAALAKRAPLVGRTDAMRLVHGESDGLPAVVVDRFAETLVVTSYAAGADRLARYCAHRLWRLRDPALPAQPACIWLRPAKRRQAGADTEALVDSEPGAARVIAGVAVETTTIHEDGRTFAVDLGGQKTGTYLDLRGLRRTVAELPLTDARVLNLFSYSGMLGRAAEHAGAREIVQVDQSARALAFAAAHHVTDAAKHRFLEEDVFEWFPGIDDPNYDLVIVDPPAMTSRAAQIPTTLAAYRKLYRAAAKAVKPGGLVVAACCTSRIDRPLFHKTVKEALGAGFEREREIPLEPDHPVTFPQADYLKIALWRRAM